MKRFSISDIETLTGIKAHTLRIWEQRYNFISPKRTETNIRYYDDDELRLFLNIATLNQSGHKISKISLMTGQEIIKAVNELKEDHFNSSVQVQMLANATLRLDEKEFNELLWGCINETGMERAMDEVIFPMFRKIGFMWQIGTICPAHEHFATHLVSCAIISATNKLKNVKAYEGKKYLLFLPPGELHEIGLLYAKYVLKAKGQQVLYLGINVPFENLSEVLPYYEPDYALSVLTKVYKENEINQVIIKMLDNLGDVPLILAGTQVADHKINPGPRLTLLRNVNDFNEIINSLAISMAS